MIELKIMGPKKAIGHQPTLALPPDAMADIIADINSGVEKGHSPSIIARRIRDKLKIVTKNSSKPAEINRESEIPSEPKVESAMNLVLKNGVEKGLSSEEIAEHIRIVLENSLLKDASSIFTPLVKADHEHGPPAAEIVYFRGSQQYRVTTQLENHQESFGKAA